MCKDQSPLGGGTCFLCSSLLILNLDLRRRVELLLLWIDWSRMNKWDCMWSCPVGGVLPGIALLCWRGLYLAGDGASWDSMVDEDVVMEENCSVVFSTFCVLLIEHWGQCGHSCKFNLSFDRKWISNFRINWISNLASEGFTFTGWSLLICQDLLPLNFNFVDSNCCPGNLKTSPEALQRIASLTF